MGEGKDIREGYRRFDKRNIVFEKEKYDMRFFNYGKDMYDNAENVIAKAEDGYGRADFAMAMAGWCFFDMFRKYYDRSERPQPASFMQKGGMRPLAADDPIPAAALVKKAALRFGADLAGITAADEQWIYADEETVSEKTCPRELEHAIVLAIHMDAAELSKSPSAEACIENDLKYAKAAFTAGLLSEFIRNLGYRAQPSVNSEALNIPLAIDAGLGALGRNGLLNTKEFGPSVKLFKVLTDMPLAHDTPSADRLMSVCSHCSKCAEACESGAISFGEPVYTGKGAYNNEGVRKWYVDHEKCYGFWIENGCECSTCIAACPMAK